MKYVFRPFWSYDVEKTEYWLSSMAMKGYHLINVNTVTSVFYFEQNSPQKIKYFIGFEKGVILSTKLVNERECIIHKYISNSNRFSYY